ncbi:DNA-binding transcriptional MocR family regulator [Bradyrhizobium yuanmingense]|uniref:DNA-binding transcriptional MocR family regulator n=3 Tax=Nitrobacteraceae TaxID=41294 RepID=A0ABV4GSI8_9BRAD
MREPADARINLEVNYPLLPQQWAMIAKSLAGLERIDALESALRVSTSTGTKSARVAAAAYLARKDFAPQPEQIFFTANGKQSLAAALAALVPTGGRCGVEALTYPYVKSIAARLGVTLVPIPMDEFGARPDAIQKAHREAHLSALYLQPIIQNPLGVTMNATRRADIMRVAEKLDLTIIEDIVYGFLADDTPLAALGPDRCIVLDSLSKKVAPGLALGILVAPPHLRESVMSAVRTGGWIASGHALAAGQRLMADGTVAELTRLKRIDAARRQQTAARLLAGYQLAADPRSYHLWLTLPPHWRSQTFVAAAARRGIALTPSSTFAIAHGHAPNAVRLALAPPSPEQLDSGLRTIASLLGTKEDDFDSTE